MRKILIVFAVGSVACFAGGEDDERAPDAGRSVQTEPYTGAYLYQCVCQCSCSGAGGVSCSPYMTSLREHCAYSSLEAGGMQTCASNCQPSCDNTQRKCSR